MSHKLEVWQRGPLPEITPLLQPVAHALLQAREELELYLADFSDELLWIRPAGLASVSFHMQHLSGVLDRVFTYARASGLNEEQFKQLADEDQLFISELSTANLLARFSAQVDLAMAQLQITDPDTLTEYRGVGRAGLPSTVIGLLVHAAEHTMRHVGQLMVTAAVVKNGGM